MNFFNDYKMLLKGRTHKKLAAFSLGVFLLITLIVFFSVFIIQGNSNQKRVDEYLGEIPKIIASNSRELEMSSGIYEEDALARAELGLKLYEEENGLTEVEKLEKARNMVSAASISVVDDRRQILSSTGPVSPEENFSAAIQTLEPRVPHMELYPAISEDGKKTEQSDGKGFVMLPVSGNTKRSLVFEFSCDPILELRNDFTDWSGVFARMLSGEDAVAFAKTGDRITGYPLDGFTDEQLSRLYEELPKAFQSNGRFRFTGKESTSRLITLQGNHYLAAHTYYPQEETDVLLAVPLNEVIGNSIYIAASISAIIGMGMVLIRIYIFRCLRQNKEAFEADGAFPLKKVLRLTWPGIVLVLVVTVLFANMLLMLENRSNATFTAMSKRNNVQHEIESYKKREDSIRRTYTDFYRNRAQMLAAYLTEYPDQQTREGLQELNHIAGAEYLMLFDSSGQELISSNSYTGFSVGSNLSDEYRAVLLGYPNAVVGPSADPYTGQIQLGTAILMTDTEGKPDGFLLAVYKSGDLKAELERMNYESAVNTFAVQKGHVAAAINDEDGRFIAHTDPAMIGQKAADYLKVFEPGSSFEGFADYKGDQMCVSAASSNGRTLLFMVPDSWNTYSRADALPLALGVAVLLILGLLFYPVSALLTSKVTHEVKKDLQTPDGKGSPILVFIDGYDLFLTLFALFAIIASAHGWWTSFDYVFSGKWSRGVHLFSLWAALLITIAVYCIGLLFRNLLAFLENRLSVRAKTITKLLNSLISYASVIFLVFCILDMFGVNTTALLASAGVLSLAVGMGAKSMAEDLLAGFFMMMGGSIHVGDQVSVGGVTGDVTDMGIRTTEITDDDGNIVIINNSKVTGVRNMSKSHEKKTPDKDGKDISKK